MEKAVVLGLGVNKASASEALSGGVWDGGGLGRQPAAIISDSWQGANACVTCLFGPAGWAVPAARQAVDREGSCSALAHAMPACCSPFCAAVVPTPPPPTDLIERYAQLLAANGRLKIALEYLQMIPGGSRLSVCGCIAAASESND